MRRSACCFSLVRRYQAIVGMPTAAANEQAKRQSREQEGLAEMIVLFAQIDIRPPR